jgi:hypothetical protein
MCIYRNVALNLINNVGRTVFILFSSGIHGDTEITNNNPSPWEGSPRDGKPRVV